MANALYGKGREGFLGGDIDWDADNIKLALCDSSDYTVSIDVDDFLDDIPGAAIVATSGNFANKTKTLGVADADDITLTSVTGDQSELIIIYKDTGSAATSRLIAKIDTATNLPVIPNGGNIVISWDNGANKIFKL